MRGPPPEDQQVVDFVKNWRRKNPNNEMAPTIEICNGHRYEQQDIATLDEFEMMI
ncbi:hypothetical protein PHYSODRAFT_441855, partial [Phytophthora sojae]